MELRNKTILITGGAKRLGAGIAKALASQGATVVIHYSTSEAQALQTIQDIEDLGGRAIALQCDLSDDAQIQPFMDALLFATNGKLDAIINNASEYKESSILDVTQKQLEEAIQLHVSAPLALIKRFVELEHTEVANIINILDARITTYDSQHAAYHLSKRMLFSVTRMLACELAPNIKVNAIAPGAVLQQDTDPPGYLEHISQFNPLKTHGTIDGIADCVNFLLKTDFITGQVLFYDGGYHMKASMYG